MKKNAKGRSISSGRFLALHEYVMRSVAWRSLSPQDRAVYLEILRRYDGKNNGRIGLSVRDAAVLCNVNKDTAAKCFVTLEARGFIERAQDGAFTYKMRHAAEWRLTQHRCDRTNALASKAFVNWRPPGDENTEISAPPSQDRAA